MFARSPRGVFDFTAAALCVWAAAYHTPAGALVRGVAARVTHSTTTVRPLLAYYSGGVYDAQEVETPSTPTPALPADVSTWAAQVPPGAALGRGVFATLSRLGPSSQLTADAVAQRYALKSPASPDEVTALLERVKGDLPSDEAAVLSLFVGYDVAAYAVQRARAEGRPLTLESLVDQLPPSRQASSQAASASLALGTAYSLAWPLRVRAPVTSPFGYRMHPITGQQQFHSGVDLAVPRGTEVHAVADGVVRRASEDALNGRVVIIDHGHGVSTAYCHNEELLVATGQRISAGQVIAQSGTTGRSTGPHVHYQLELAHKPTDPFAFRSAQLGDVPLPLPPPGAVVPRAPTQGPARPSGAGPSAALKSAFDQVQRAPKDSAEPTFGLGPTETGP